MRRESSSQFGHLRVECLRMQQEPAAAAASSTTASSGTGKKHRGKRAAQPPSSPAPATPEVKLESQHGAAPATSKRSKLVSCACRHCLELRALCRDWWLLLICAFS